MRGVGAGREVVGAGGSVSVSICDRKEGPRRGCHFPHCCGRTVMFGPCSKGYGSHLHPFYKIGSDDAYFSIPRGGEAARPTDVLGSLLIYIMVEEYTHQCTQSITLVDKAKIPSPHLTRARWRGQLRGTRKQPFLSTGLGENNRVTVCQLLTACRAPFPKRKKGLITVSC